MFQQLALTSSAAALSDDTLLFRSSKIDSIPWRSSLAICILTLIANWLITDIVHLDVGIVTIIVVIGGWWWLMKPAHVLSARIPLTLDELKERCQRLLIQFEKLDENKSSEQEMRRNQLEHLCSRHGRQVQELALVGTSIPTVEAYQNLALAVAGSTPITLHQAHPLTLNDKKWRWPESLQQCDQLIFFIDLPMQAADLRWLEHIPEKQSIWMLIQTPKDINSEDLEQKQIQLQAQLPVTFKENLIFWDGEVSTLKKSVKDYTVDLHCQGDKRILKTEKRLLKELYLEWNTELETIRNIYFSQLQKRVQWTVAAGVFASPLPSVDLLVLVIANSMMLEEMARLWDCPWNIDQLKEAATELAKVALSLGIIEWSSQSLLNLAKLEGGTWLVSSSIQALSAAYLTRVVSRSMANLLAIQSSGVTSLEPQDLKHESLVLVAHAVETEKLDWLGFLQNSQQWLKVNFK